MSKEVAIIQMELAAAKAKQLAEDMRYGKLWDGEFLDGITEIRQSLARAIQENASR